MNIDTNLVFLRHISGPVVQLDRMADFGSAGCRFESCQGHKLLFISLYLYCRLYRIPITLININWLFLFISVPLTD